MRLITHDGGKRARGGIADLTSLIQRLHSTSRCRSTQTVDRPVPRQCGHPCDRTAAIRIERVGPSPYREIDFLKHVFRLVPVTQDTKANAKQFRGRSPVDQPQGTSVPARHTDQGCRKIRAPDFCFICIGIRCDHVFAVPCPVFRVKLSTFRAFDAPPTALARNSSSVMSCAFGSARTTSLTRGKGVLRRIPIFIGILMPGIVFQFRSLFNCPFLEPGFCHERRQFAHRRATDRATS